MKLAYCNVDNPFERSRGLNARGAQFAGIVSFVIAVVAVLGCPLIPDISTGGDSSVDEGPNGVFTWQFSNAITFKNPITVTVDSVFARLRNGDKDMRSAAEQFMRPAQNLLSSKYAIPISLATPIADRKDLRLSLAPSGPSPWAEKAGSPLGRLPVTSDGHRQTQWRANQLSASAIFSSLNSQEVDVDIKLELEIQVRTGPDDNWTNAKLDVRQLEELRRELHEDLVVAYRDFLKMKGVEIKTVTHVQH